MVHRKLNHLPSRSIPSPLVDQLNEADQLIAFLTKLVDKQRSQLEEGRCQQEKIKGEVEQLKQCLKEEKSKKVKMMGGNSCVKNESADRQDHLSNLPEEVLVIILDNLTDPKDVASCSRTCRKFEKILMPTKSAWLFHEIFLHILDYLPKNDLLKCRLVCKWWKGDVDNFLENVGHQEDVVSPKISFHEETPRYWEYGLTISSSHDMAKFTSQMESHTGNPFIGRRVEFNPFMENFWGNLVKFLEKFGRHLWDCKIVITDALPVEFITILRDCLRHMPNLRRLTLFGEPLEDNGVILGDHFSAIERDLGELPFPLLPNFTGLELENFIPRTCLFLLPINYWRRLERLELTDLIYDQLFDANHTILRSGLTNLKTLILKDVSDTHWTDLSKLLLLKCPQLRTLKIDNNSSQIDFTAFLRVLQHFGQSLRHVKLERRWTFPVVGREVRSNLAEYLDTSLELSLPQLEILELVNPIDSFNFLVALSNPGSLKYLSIDCSSLGISNQFLRERRHEIFKIYGYVQRMYESNVWIRLPNLIEFKFVNEETVVSRYTRNGYKDFVRRALELQ